MLDFVTLTVGFENFLLQWIQNTFSCRSEEPGFFDGVCLAQDSEVSNFVEEVRGAVKNVSLKRVRVTKEWGCKVG